MSQLRQSPGWPQPAGYSQQTTRAGFPATPQNWPERLPLLPTRLMCWPPANRNKLNQSHLQTTPWASCLPCVADDYRQTIRYPEYSIPLTPAQAEAYQGNRYHPVALPLEGDGEFVVTLDKFRFKRGEPILVAASLTGRQVFGDTMSATLESIPDRDREDSAVLESVEPGYYEGTVSSDHDPGEYRLIVEARVDSSAVRHVSTLNIEPDLGNFEGLERPYVTGNDLVIPVKFDPKNSGHYSLSAQLYSGNTPWLCYSRRPH